MHLPLLRAFDPYLHGHSVARGDKTKPAEVEPFVVASVLEKPASESRFHGGRRKKEAPERDAPPFEQALTEADGGAPMPEDALDAQELCALLEAAARSRD